VRVLLVDDEAAGRDAMAWVLLDAGAEVTALGSAEAAVAALSTATENLPHVLVSDIGMPGEDGYQLIERIRAMPLARGGAIPAAAVTAYATEADRRRALASGFQTHLAKPLDPDELVAAVVALVGTAT
jgi:CheY-like chemotaxis protein